MYEGVEYALTVPGNETAVVGIPPANNISWITPPPPPASTVQQSADSLVFENIRATSAVIRLIFSTPQSNPSATSIVINTPTGFSYNVNYALGLIYVYGLLPGVTYGPWEISFGTNIRSYAETFITDPLPPLPITNVVVSNVTSNSCSVAWLGGDELIQGDYDFAFNGVSINPTTITHVLGVGFATFVGSLEPSTSYSLVVGFYDNFENVVEAPPVSFTTANGPPPAPPITPITNVTFTNVTDTSFQLNWLGGSEFPNLYAFSVSPFATSPSSLGSDFAVFTGLAPSTPYSVELQASNGVTTVQAGPANVTTTSSANPIYPLTGLSQTFTAATAVEISWTGGGTQASNYSFTLNGSPPLFAPDFRKNGPTEWAVAFSPLTPDTDYLIVLNVSNGIETITPAPSISVRTLAYTPNADVSITFFSVENIESTSITVKILADVTGQPGSLPKKLQASFTLNGVPTLPAGASTQPTPFTSGDNFTFIGLLPNTLYTIQTVVRNQGSNNTATATLQDRTTAPGVPLSPITNEDVLNITSSGFDATWSGGDGVLADYSFTLNGNNAVPSAKTVSSATFIGLSPSTQYTLIITCDNGTSNVQSAPILVTTLA